MSTIIVNTNLDETAVNATTSLREALAIAQGASGADTIVFAAGVSKVDLGANGALIIQSGQNVTINGDQNGDGVADVTVDGHDLTGLFIVQAGAFASLQSLTFYRGKATGTVGEWGDYGGHPGGDGGLAGGAILNYGNTSVARSEFLANTAIGGIGGLGGYGSYVAGYGGEGGTGGGAAGAIANAGTLFLADNILGRGNGNSAVGGQGGRGGLGGLDQSGLPIFPYDPGLPGGPGGDGGDGGAAAGAILNLGTLHGAAQVVSGNQATGGAPGSFGPGGYGGEGSTYYGAPGLPGDFGPPGNPGTVTGSANNGIANTGAGTGTVVEAETVYYIHRSSLSVDEGTGGVSTFTFYINRNGNYNQAAAVSWSLGHLTTDAADFIGPISGTANFATASETSIAVSIGISPDTLAELDKRFLLEIDGVTSAGPVTFATGTASLAMTLADDDALVTRFRNGPFGDQTVLETYVGPSPFAEALADAQTWQGIDIVDPAVGDVGAVDIGVDRLTIRAGAPFDADFTLVGAARTLVLQGSANISVTAHATRSGALVGNDGDNILTGRGGYDLLEGGAGRDTLLGGEGTDTILIRAGDIAFGPETWDGGAGRDTLGLSAPTANAVFDLSTHTARSLERVELFNFAVNGTTEVLFRASQFGDGGFALTTLIVGALGVSETLKIAMEGDLAVDLSRLCLASFSDPGDRTEITGGNAAEIIIGTSIGDFIDGGGGVDRMAGGLGDDTYVVDEKYDSTVERPGGGANDKVISSVTHALRHDVEQLELSGSANLNGAGNDLANTIAGNSGNNIMNGRGGEDTMIGGAGNDTYYVDDPGDLVVEDQNSGTDSVVSSISYTLAANVEKLHLFDGAADGTGNELENAIYGNSGNNVIDGKEGNDKVTGGGGSDQFLFATALGASNIDTVTDFTVALDRIGLEDSVFAGLAVGTLAASAFAIGIAATGASDRIAYNNATGALYFDADGTGAGAAQQFAWIGTGQMPTAGDFFVF